MKEMKDQMRKKGSRLEGDSCRRVREHVSGKEMMRRSSSGAASSEGKHDAGEGSMQGSQC